MRVVLCGAQTKGILAIERFLASGHQLLGVVTHPPESDRFTSMWDASVEDFCRSKSLPVLTARRLRSPAQAAWISRAQPDILAFCNWRTIVPESIFTVPPRGAVNVHESLLPRYAGLSPVLWARVEGEREVGVTTHHVIAVPDAGDIILQERIAFDPELPTRELLADRIYPTMARLLVDTVTAIEWGTAPRRPQDLTQRTFYHARVEEDNRIDWADPPQRILNLIRAHSDPYPNAYTYHNGQQLLVTGASLPSLNFNGTPGRIAARIPGGVVVICGRDPGEVGQGLLLEEVRLPASAAVPASQYFAVAKGNLG